jgi:uncharacterized membrane protein YphA (DoxX/SURF4 family)
MRKMFTFVLLFALLFIFAGAPSWGYDVLKSPTQIEAIGSSPPANVIMANTIISFELYVPMVTVGIATAPAAISSIKTSFISTRSSGISSEANLLNINYATDNLRHWACAGVTTIRAV